MVDLATDELRRTFDTACRGDAQAASRLLPLVYDELRRLARSLLAQGGAGKTLQPTALVHEAYLRIAGSRDRDWSDRKHFFSVAAVAMRNTLVDEARRKKALKRGGDRVREPVRDEDLAVECPTDDVIGLAEALRALEAEDPRAGEVVNLRFFAGLPFPETAQVLGVSLATVERDWRFARAWLLGKLGGVDEPGEQSGG